MPFVVVRDRWRRQPVPGRVQFDLNHWSARGIWGAQAVAERVMVDLLRQGQATLTLNTNNREVNQRESAFGRVFTIWHNAGNPYYWQRGRYSAVSTSSMTLAAILGGHGLTAVNVRALVSSGLAGLPMPGIYEGSGGTNVWRAQFRTASSTDVVVNGTTTAVAGGPAYFIVARREAGVGLSLFVNGVSEGFTSSALGMSGSPAILQSSGALSFQDASALTLAWNRALSDYEIQELSRNPWQVLKPQKRRVFYSLAGGPSFQAAWARGATTIAGVSANA